MKDVKIDDRMAFYAWISGGSLERGSAILASQGSYNKNTGENWHRGSLKQAANRFILRNVEEARKVYTEQGSILNSRQWEAKLVVAACKTFSRKNFISWVKDNPWSLNYPMLIDRRFPNLSEVILSELQYATP